jgi:carbon-monoxide dehydrogenase medium subunit
MAAITDYIRPTTLKDALDLLQSDPEGTRLLAGGANLLLKHRAVADQSFKLIDISRVKELIGVQETKLGIRIGAATKLKDIA